MTEQVQISQSQQAQKPPFDPEAAFNALRLELLEAIETSREEILDRLQEIGNNYGGGYGVEG